MENIIVKETANREKALTSYVEVIESKKKRGKTSNGISFIKKLGTIILF